MQFSSEGYIIKLRNHGERSVIITVVCPQYGKITGYVRGALSRKNTGMYQIGNYISFNAYARVEENMLNFRGVELLHSFAVDFMNSHEKIKALTSLCRLLDMCVAEQDDLGVFFGKVKDFFLHIKESNWLVYYSLFEFYLLDFLGIGLDLSKCAVTGTKNNLAYVSPKTGRSVCAKVGAPYKDKLYAYPKYIVEHNYMPDNRDVMETLLMTGQFLDKNFLAQHNMRLPDNRLDLLNVIKL